LDSFRAALCAALFLEKYGVLDYTNAMKDENDVKMYVKFKGGK